MRLAVWSPLPPTPSGIADHVAEALPALARRAEVTVVVEDPGAVAADIRAGLRVVAAGETLVCDLDLYAIGNSPAHAYVYRAALARPGVVWLHEWGLHHLVLREALERGAPEAYRRDMRRAHGERGSLVAGQVLRGLGGDLLPALFPLNERLLETSLGLVATTETMRAAAKKRLGERRTLHLPLHFALPIAPVPSRAEARRRLGLPESGLLVVAPGLATRAKGLDLAVRIVARLRARHSTLRLVVAGEAQEGLPLQAWAEAAGLREALLVTGRLGLPDFARHLVAADVVLCLRFPSYGEMSAALVRALGIGRPALVTAGTPPALEFPEGVVVPLDPGPHQEREAEALLDHLLKRADLREAIGRLAREHVARHHDLENGLDRLVGFLEEILAGKDETQKTLAAERAAEGTLLGYLLEEARRRARELGLPQLPLRLEGLLAELCG